MTLSSNPPTLTPYQRHHDAIYLVAYSHLRNALQAERIVMRVLGSPQAHKQRMAGKDEKAVLKELLNTTHRLCYYTQKLNEQDLLSSCAIAFDSISFISLLFRQKRGLTSEVENVYITKEIKHNKKARQLHKDFKSEYARKNIETVSFRKSPAIAGILMATGLNYLLHFNSQQPSIGGYVLTAARLSYPEFILFEKPYQELLNRIVDYHQAILPITLPIKDSSAVKTAPEEPAKRDRKKE